MRIPKAAGRMALGAILCLAGRACAEERPRALADFVPAETILHVSIEDLPAFRRQAGGTALAKTFRDEEVRPALRELEKLLREQGREIDRDLEGILPVLEGLRYLKGADLAGIEAAAWIVQGPKGKPALRWAAQVRCAGPSTVGASVQRGLARIWDVALDRLEAREIPGGKYWNDSHDFSFAVVDEGTVCRATGVAGMSMGAEALLSPFRKPAGSPLAASADFLAARKALPFPQVGMYAYLALAPLKQALARDPQVQRELDLDLQDPTMRTIIRMTGLDQARSLSLSVAVDGEGFTERVLLHSPGPRSMLLSLFGAGRAGPFRSFAKLKGDALGAVAAKVSWPDLRAAYRAVKSTLPEEDRRDVESAVADCGARTGLASADLLAALGDEVAIAFGKPVGLIPIPPITLIAEVRDAKKAEDCLAKLAEYAAAQGAPRTKTPFSGRTLYQFGDPNKRDEISMFFQPTFAVTETHLAAGSNPQVLKSLLGAWKRDDFPSLAASPSFRALGGKIPAEACTAVYLDLPQVLSIAYSTSLQFAGLAAGFGGGREPAFDLNLLPTAEALTRHLPAALSWTRLSPDGVRVESWSPIGVNPMPLDPVCLAGYAAALIPLSIESKRNRARWECQSNLNSIHWSFQNGGVTATTMQDLLAGGNLNVMLLYCPRDPGRPARHLTGDAAASWLKGHPPSYRILWRNFGKPGMVTAFEREAAHRGKRHVLFGDGSVREMGEEEFGKLSAEHGLIRPPRQKRELTPELAQEIAGRIGSLGSPDFELREAATRWLLETGPVASEALRKAAASEDLETRTRAERILRELTEE